MHRGRRSPATEEGPFFQLAPADVKLLKMLVFEPDVRAKVLSEEVETFFFDPNACQLAHAVLGQLQGVEEGDELVALAKSPDLLARLPQPLKYDPVEYAGLGEDWLESCRRKTADKRMRQKIKSRSFCMKCKIY